MCSIWFSMIVMIMMMKLFLKFSVVLMLFSVWMMGMFRFEVLISVVIIIIDSDSMMVWFRFVMICGKVLGSLIFYSNWCGVVLKVIVVLISVFGVEEMFR